MQPPWGIGPSPIGPSAGIEDEQMRTTPDGTPYYPADDHGTRAPSPEDVKSGAVLVLLFFLVLASVLVALAGASSVGSEACLFLFIIIVVVAVVFLRLAFGESLEPETHELQEPYHEVVRIETIRETVKVRCRYCGTLNLVTDTRCQSCGGTL